MRVASRASSAVRTELRPVEVPANSVHGGAICSHLVETRPTGSRAIGAERCA